MSCKTLDTQKCSEDSRLQLGTLGSGNHFLEFQSDEQNSLWLMLHTGSRNLGQSILQHHLPKTRKLSTSITALDAASQHGRDYLQDLQIARAWARENRRLLAVSAARAAEEILGATPLLHTLHDCDHNHLQTEPHHNQQLFVHRKGATNAAKSTPGIIPGSMGTRSYHTLGQGNPDSLHSSSHGAGRALSRTQAREKITTSLLRQQLHGVWYDARLEPSLREEAPTAYRKIDEVMRAQSALTTIARKLRPLLIHKGA